ncbi:hypothetical protein [Streptomyces parvulus]|uniref:Bifunctional protein n=1 Tax=Streptomyces parvulus TaxID=146923 RepID=A0A369V018_9ACTN|nr:hypothetical protein [Streptomyces parvulus]RDD86382.1 hypothetical protein DVZ84_25465 [Streptomyces parvulus]
MKHIPFFRWFVTLGLVLIGCSVGVYLATPDYPELEQVDLTVLNEAPDGTCTVRWTDPFERVEHTGPYQCDRYRPATLKAPDYEPGTDLGWDVGYVLAEGSQQGELYSLADDEDIEASIALSDQLLGIGLLPTILGLVGGNIRSLARVIGARPAVVREGARLRERAVQTAQDHARAEEAVCTAWAPLHEELVEKRLDRIPVVRLRGATRTRLPVRRLEQNGIHSVRDVLEAGAWEVAHVGGLGRQEAERMWAAARRMADRVSRETTVRLDTDPPDARTVALLNALHVLVEAGPRARRTADTADSLAGQLHRALAGAAPAAGWRKMLEASRAERRGVPAAVAELRRLLTEAEREGVAARFAQASVDLLRGADGDVAGLSARVDFDTRPADYYGVLAQVVDTAEGTEPTPPGSRRRLTPPRRPPRHWAR